MLESIVQNRRIRSITTMYYTSSPPVHEREILVRAPKDFIFKIYQKAYDASRDQGKNSLPWPVPRMVSLRSSGMPVHKWLLPSTIVRHSSRAACSAPAPEGRRC